MRRGAAAIVARASLPVLTRLDPEVAHDVGLAGLRWLQRLWPERSYPPAWSVRCFGLEFSHPLGLAAGFDKNGDSLDALGAMGFSHIELGTVTPRPQPGNPKPRMFRIREASALINRMGFNNKGVDHLAAQLSRSRYRGIRGISIGKNFDTPIENAQDDYVACLRKVYALADYIAVNISSPNTARLRELQTGDALQRVLGALFEERRVQQQRHGKRVPVLIKIAPDLTVEQISALARDLRALEVDGLIATNTSTDRGAVAKSPAAAESGGLSGAPLHPKSVRVIAQLRAELGPHFPIIGVGGIVSAEHARATLRAGANLIQIYTGFAYRGEALLGEILDALSA
ncbi:MAG TPA: quinone-dependent dihydroorotate dehydrogenase [Steroidobacteraceae bacterium]|nr:quinone-dependent dihydroorotate dehydrogenase [Steroidobacteraceae bacterium]